MAAQIANYGNTITANNSTFFGNDLSTDIILNAGHFTMSNSF